MLVFGLPGAAAVRTFELSCGCCTYVSTPVLARQNVAPLKILPQHAIASCHVLRISLETDFCELKRKYKVHAEAKPTDVYILKQQLMYTFSHG